MIELGGKNRVLLGERSILFGQEELPVPNNLHNFFVAGGYAYYGLSYEGEKPPRAVFSFRGGRLVLFQNEGKCILTYQKGEQNLSRMLRGGELRIFLDWVRERNMAVGVEDLVFFKKDGVVHLYDLSIEEGERKLLFYTLEDNLRQAKPFQFFLKEGKIVSDSKRITFLRKGEKGLIPVGSSIKHNQDNLLRVMSIL